MIGWFSARPADAVVETAGVRDSAALAALHKTAFARGWSEQEFDALLIERNAVAHRLRLKNKVVGFIISRVAADEAEILSVVVDRAHRGHGLATRLLTGHLGQLAGAGARTVFLEVEETNAAARHLYRRAGFRDVARRDGYYRQSGTDSRAAIVMRRTL